MLNQTASFLRKTISSDIRVHTMEITVGFFGFVLFFPPEAASQACTATLAAQS